MNETTNVSTFTLVYGSLPHGPSAVLREMWLNESNFPAPKNKSTVEYLTELCERLTTALSFAQSHAEKAQQQYVDRYNARSCAKSFQVGEPVLVLQKDSSASKVFSRWMPGLVTHVQSPNSYVVEFDDGSSRTIHVNHLRKFHTRAQKVLYDPIGLSGEPDVNSCAIVSEQDQEFGDLHAFDYDCAGIGIDSKDDSQLPSQLIDRSTLCHLSARQQGELLQILDKYADCKVPERLKQEVQRQLDDMLASGIIQESNSPMASPLVCVLKGKGGCNGIRLDVDYRYLNSYTVGDAFQSISQSINRFYFRQHGP